jgi:hypothetical protein
MGTLKVHADASVKGTTLFSEGDVIAPSGVYLPAKHDNKATKLDVILWFHGFYVADYTKHLFGPSTDGRKANLRESVDAAGKDVVLIAPWLGLGDHDKAGNAVGDYGSLKRFDMDDPKKGLVQYLDEVLGLLAQQQGVAKLEIGRLILAGHSGGGRRMQIATGTLGSYLGKLIECWGFDCMYSTGRDYGCWADGLPGTAFYFYLGNMSDATEFVNFWTYAYGTPAKPEPQAMFNVCLAPGVLAGFNANLAPPVKGRSVKIKVPALETLNDTEVFQTFAAIKAKTAPTDYEQVRQFLDDKLDNAKGWHAAIKANLKEHYQVVRDLMEKRIRGIGSKPWGNNQLAHVRIAACKKFDEQEDKRKKAEEKWRKKQEQGARAR